MRPDVIVVLAPGFDEVARLGEGVEDFAIEEFVAQLADEALAVAILPGAAGSDEQGHDAELGEPVSHLPGHELGSVVGADVVGHAVRQEEFSQDFERVVAGQASCCSDG